MKHIVLFANGELAAPDAARAVARTADYLIAADGGARHCQALGLTPHLVIGDLDSFPPEARAALEQAGTRFVVYPAHKDETDLELALLHALAQGAERVTVLAALGGRLDMTLANIFLLTHPRLATLPIEICHATQRIWLIRPPGADIPGAPGDTLSLLPLAGPARGLVTHGLAYPLHGEDLQPGPARGVSNQLVSRPARVELQSGLLLAVLTAGSA